MPPRHRLLAVLVAVTWGVNFLAIDASLRHFPPFLLAALRFTVIAVPTLLLVPRPAVPGRWLLGHGIGFGILQFLFLYWAMYAGIQPGLASLVLQSSAPFTVFIGAVVFGERITRRRLVGLMVAVLGLAVVGWQRSQLAGALGPFLLVLAGGFGWAIGNVCNARAKAPNPFHLTLWMSVIPPLPMFALSLLVEGPRQIGAAFATTEHLAGALGGLAYTVLIGTLLGSGVWSWLMARHPASLVAPFSMLVPVVGLSTSAALLGEQLTGLEILGAALVVGGVLYGAAGARRGPNARSAVPPSAQDHAARGQAVSPRQRQTAGSAS
ncbi:EamA family transporter [Frankia sp. CNm7]|uniref:EamA family transporter n=1 Tax=Frankia nepalensis TaxID=1836974 RepID=A0A937UQ78_9ACTN|nr:EamA family transporter [Frankia nepalensis]MBL7501803.1 EamA family transporter [Frankia nepalensis]MBL7513899.1 EamA family transporter [Frankia nepalensis]MBL7519678.1 EamA family transporter [Frankia nepalensis]MBL7626371.1 EamA family transporter [Frankia nepalensis]